MSPDRQTLKEFPLRIGLISTGLILLNFGIDLWILGQSFQRPLSLGLSAAAWAVGMLFLILGLATRVSGRLTWLILISLLVTQAGYAYLQRLNYAPLTSSHTDNEMIAEFAVQALKRGQDPYAWNFADILRVFRDQGTFFTPLLDGTYQHRLTYPILPTLVLFAFDRLGLGQVRTIGLIFHLLLFCLLFGGAPARLRPLVLLPLFLFKGFNFFTLNGVQDIVWSALLVGMILAWQRPTWRAVLFGLACAYRQQPWLVAPFLLIHMWNEPGTASERRRRMVQFLAISGGVFVLINLPFILWNPRDWWLGALEPSYARFNVFSHALGALSQFGLAPFPREFYAGLQFSAYLILLALHWHHPRLVGQAFWVFPGLFFWLYYRGLDNYWIYWLPPLLLGIARHLKEMSGASPASAPEPSARWRRTAALAAALLLPNLLWGMALLRRDPPMELRYSVVLETMEGQWVNRLWVKVANTSRKELRPRFAVQHDPGVQAMPWTIESGPERLAPGQAGDYLISTASRSKAFPIGEGGQVVVTDAGGDYALRAVLTIPADRSFTDPDAIVNPDFYFWPAGGAAPTGWGLWSTNWRAASSQVMPVGGRNALVIHILSDHKNGEPTVVRLTQDVTFPTEFSIWVYPTPRPDDPLKGAYGLELDDGEHKLWVLFGASNSRGLLQDDVGYVYMRSPLNSWSQHAIRPQDLYALFGWPLPPFTLRQRNGLEFAARQLQLSLLLTSDSEDARWAAFGPIEQSIPVQPAQTLVGEALAHPDVYYANLGDDYRRQRNYDLAEEAYMKALTHYDESPASYFGLGESYFWLGQYEQAVAAFQRSLQNGYRVAESYRGLAWSKFNLGDFNSAESYFLSALQANPSLADAYNGMGWVRLRQARCDEAIRYFEQALKLDPNFPDPQRGMEACAPS